ncbi:hypothetical protein AV530_016329 [Patagioenas fasciata monilis]|uniref:Uncharacterized protein n=1 Tax=Patagioenas fasciata monilis TaxID=372326 RepID=A0A1V4KWA7_PATFA|nr:hypothetical protein AV530_016329 [Patagioenas fasciata monilis]
MSSCQETMSSKKGRDSPFHPWTSLEAGVMETPWKRDSESAAVSSQWVLQGRRLHLPFPASHQESEASTHQPCGSSRTRETGSSSAQDSASTQNKFCLGRLKSQREDGKEKRPHPPSSAHGVPDCNTRSTFNCRCLR